MSDANCCEPGEGRSGFQVEAVVTVDERGQMVLPKDLRQRAGIAAGDKLALISWERDGEVCCLSLVKREALRDMLRGVLGPMVEELSMEQG